MHLAQTEPDIAAWLIKNLPSVGVTTILGLLIYFGWLKGLLTRSIDAERRVQEQKDRAEEWKQLYYEARGRNSQLVVATKQMADVAAEAMKSTSGAQRGDQ
jgi:hypothetical protein